MLTVERAATPLAPSVMRAYRAMLDASSTFRTRVRLVSRPDRTDPDLVSVADLLGSPAIVDELLDATARRLEREHGVRPPLTVTATRALHDYAWPATLLLSAPWFLHDRVPLVRHTDVSLRLSTGLLEVTPVERARDGELDAALLAAVAEHHGPVVEALGSHLRRGRRAVWGLVTDDLLSGIWHLGRELGDEDAGVRAAERLLPTATGPFPGGACFRQLTAEDGVPHTTRTRLTCCLHYRIAADACVTCPRTSDAERATRLAQR